MSGYFLQAWGRNHRTWGRTLSKFDYIPGRALSMTQGLLAIGCSFLQSRRALVCTLHSKCLTPECHQIKCRSSWKFQSLLHMWPPLEGRRSSHSHQRPLATFAASCPVHYKAGILKIIRKQITFNQGTRLLSAVDDQKSYIYFSTEV